jgi:phenylalanyl-tRNA synthetase beta chain
MKLTYNWLRDYCPCEILPEELARRLSMSGTLVEEVHNLGDDALLVAEITSNRPDLLGILGIAREVSALTGAPLRIPEADFACGEEKVSSASSVQVLDPALCPRYTARLVRGVKIGPSPDWLRLRLEAIGLRCINNVVDATNYVMFECGQPLHAFDFDKLRGGRIVVRRAAEGETMVSIDGAQRRLDPAMLVIADAERPVAVAGIMGGLDTEISDRTVSVLLESAQFENTQIRRTSRALGLASDSSYRFERGVDPVQVEWASRRALHLIQKVAGGTAADGLLDAWAAPFQPKAVTLRFARMNRVLGAAVAPDIARAILERLGFLAEPGTDPGRVTVLVPAFRAVDVYREIDLIEEVIRIYGYDRIPESGTLPVMVGRVSRGERVADLARRMLPGEGFFEAMTNSFCDEASARLVSPWTTADPLTVQNTIRHDEDRLRVSLLPGLLAVKRTNLAHGVPKSPLFEIGKLFLPKPPRASGPAEPDDVLPEERTALALLAEEGLSHLKGVIESFLDAAGVRSKVSFEPAADPFFAEKRAAKILLEGAPLGILGEVSPAVCERYGAAPPPSAAELDFDLLVRAAQLDRSYSKLPAHPAAVRDLAVVVDEAVPWARIEGAIRDLRIPILESIEFFDLFRGKQVPAGKKSVAFSLTFRAADRTLTSEEVEAARQSCIRSLNALGAALRG